MSLCWGFGYSCFGGFNARNRPDMNVAFIQSLGGTHQAHGCLMWKHYFHNFLNNGQYLCIAAGRSHHPSVTPPSPARAPHHSTYSSDLGRSWCQRASEWPSHRRCRSRAGWRALGRRTVAPCRRQVRPPRPSPATQTPARRWNWRDWLSRTDPILLESAEPGPGAALFHTALAAGLAEWVHVCTPGALSTGRGRPGKRAKNRRRRWLCAKYRLS